MAKALYNLKGTQGTKKRRKLNMNLIFYDKHPYASSVRIRLTIYEMKHSSVSHFTVKTKL